MKTDSLFYKLFSYRPALAFELADLGVKDARGYRFHSEEIKQTAFRIDGVLTPAKTARKKPIVYVEVQCQPDKEFYSRFFSEIFLHLRHQKPQHPWQALVIYSSRNIERLAAFGHYDELIASSNVHIIYLDELFEQETDNLGVQLLKLIMLEGGLVDRAKDMIAKARQIKPKTESQKLLELIETIMVYRLPDLNRKEIQKMLNFTDADLKKTQFYKDVFTEGEETGMMKGIAKGIQEGEAKGEVKGELKVVLRLCKKYYGELDSALFEQIKTLSLEKIDELSILLIEKQEAFTLDDLTNWLFPERKH